jgi:hypothetical protein
MMARRRQVEKAAISPSRTQPAKQDDMWQRKKKKTTTLISLGNAQSFRLQERPDAMYGVALKEIQSTLSPPPAPRSLFLPFASKPLPAFPALPPKIPAE